MELLVDEKSGFYVYVDPHAANAKPRLCYLVKAVGKAATALSRLRDEAALSGLLYSQFARRRGVVVAGIALLDRDSIAKSVDVLVRAVKACSAEIQVAPCTEEVTPFCVCLAPPPSTPLVRPSAGVARVAPLSVAGAPVDIVKTNRLAMEDPSDSYAYIMFSVMVFVVLLGSVMVVAKSR